MSDVTIGRYDQPHDYSGWIEGTDNAGTRWITYLDLAGRPALHWTHREQDGAVVGDPVDLAA